MVFFSLYWYLATACKEVISVLWSFPPLMWIVAHFRIPQCKPISVNMPSSLFVKEVALAELL